MVLTVVEHATYKNIVCRTMMLSCIICMCVYTLPKFTWTNSQFRKNVLYDSQIFLTHSLAAYHSSTVPTAPSFIMIAITLSLKCPFSWYILVVEILCTLSPRFSGILAPPPTVIVPSGAAREIQRTTPTHLHFANFIAHKLYALFI